MAAPVVALADALLATPRPRIEDATVTLETDVAAALLAPLRMPRAVAALVLAAAPLAVRRACAAAVALVAVAAAACAPARR